MYRQDCLLGWGNGGMAFHSLLLPWCLFVGSYTWSVSWLDMTPFLKYASCPLQFYHSSKVHTCYDSFFEIMCNVYLLNFHVFFWLNYLMYMSSMHFKSSTYLLCWVFRSVGIDWVLPHRVSNLLFGWWKLVWEEVFRCVEFDSLLPDVDNLSGEK